MTVQNDWKLLQNYLKKINLATFEVENKENDLENEFNSNVDLYYKYKRKIRLLNDDNLKLLGIIPKLNNHKKIKIISSSANLNFHSQIKNYLFEIRNNTNLLLKLIENLNGEKEKDIIAKVFVHFFFEDVTKSECSYKLNHFLSLLINQEVENLDYELKDNFIEKNSFIDKIFNEFLNRHEVKVYTKYLFEDLIKNLEKNVDNNYKYLTLYLEDLIKGNELSQFEIISIKKNIEEPKRNTVYSSSMKDFFSQSRKRHYHNQLSAVFNIKETSKLTNDDESELLNIPKFNENYLRKLLNVEKDEIRKHYIYKQLIRLSQYKKNEACFFFSYQNFIGQFQNSKKYVEILPKYMDNFRKIKDFFIDFVSNFKKYSLNLPIIIRETMKSIYNLIRIREKSKSKFEINCFVVYYFINHFIIPFLKCPSRNEILSEKLEINDNKTRKSLETIILVFTMIGYCDLFDCNMYNEYTPLNYLLMNVTIDIHKIIFDIFNNDNEGIFEDDYKEEENDIYQTICLSQSEIEIFLDKYMLLNIDHQNKGFSDIITNKDLVFPNENENNDIENNYVFINKNFDEKRKNKLKLEKIKEIIQENSKTQFVEEIKICIKQVLSNIPTLSNKGNFFLFKDIFELLNKKINYYNEEYKNVLVDNSIPLSWYSDYLISHMDLLPNEYKNNNFNNLYNELLEETETKMGHLSEKNILLLNEISSENTLLKKFVSLAKRSLTIVKDYRVKIYTKIFINTAKIDICLLNGNQKFNLIYQKKGFDQYDIIHIKANELMINKSSECLHIINGINTNNKRIEGHCSNINEFINRILTYGKEICKDIENEKDETKAKEVIETYISLIKIYLHNEDQRFHFSGKTTEKSENKLNAFVKEIEKYILTKIICNLEISSMNKEDQKIMQKCKSFLWITLEHLNIDPNQISKKQIEMVKNLLNKMDKERYYVNLLKYLVKAINIISKMIEFTTGNPNASIEEFLPILVHSFIHTMPKNMISNLKLAKYFMSQNDFSSMYGYNLANYQTCINFLNTITPKKYKLDSKKFNELCNDSMKNPSKYNN